MGLALERLPSDLWLTRPDRAARSIGESVDQLVSAMATDRLRAELAVHEPGTQVGEAAAQPVDDDVAVVDPDDVEETLRVVNTVEALRGGAARYGAFLRSIDEPAWGNAIKVAGEARSLDWGVRHSAHQVMHSLSDIARMRHRLGDVLRLDGGTVASLHASQGGVPKPEILSATIDVGGVVGDGQAARQYHGRPWQALCLWSAEVVQAWAADGHPIFPGAAGENLSLTGIDWSQVRAGLIIEIGTMTALVSAPAVPCTKNSRWFSDRDHLRLGHDLYPGRARWYASVLSPGQVRAGDPVSVYSGG